MNRRGSFILSCWAKDRRACVLWEA